MTKWKKQKNTRASTNCLALLTQLALPVQTNRLCPLSPVTSALITPVASLIVCTVSSCSKNVARRSTS